MLGNSLFWSSEVGASCTSWLVWAEAYQFTTRWDSSAPTRRMMPLMVAGAAVTTLASFMLAAAIAIRAHIVMRLRPGECEAGVAPSVIFRFIFRMPPMSDENAAFTFGDVFEDAMIGQASKRHAMGR